MGRPSTFSAETANEILQRMGTGESLPTICQDSHMPHISTVFSWFQKHRDFHEAYAQAREARAEAIFEETLSIADDGKNDWMERHDPRNPGYDANGEHIQRSKLRVDTRKWFLAKLFPAKYGDQAPQQANVTVNVAQFSAAAEQRLRGLLERVEAIDVTPVRPDA